MTKGMVSCPGSCGELFQGLVGEQEILLSYGIEKCSRVRLDRASSLARQAQGEKVRRALELLPVANAFSFVQESDLPISKGYSSSTADMVSCLQAAALGQKQLLKASDLTRLCAKIEPTDSVAFADWTVINPLTGQVVWQTDWRPELYVYILEPVEMVTTLDLVRMKDSPSYPAEESKRLLPLFQAACQEKSLEKLGHLATYSALLNNQRLPKPYLEELLNLVKKYQCLGLNVAHSGTLVGLLLSREQLEVLPKLEAELARSASGAYYQTRTLSRIIFEGVQPVREEID